MNNEKTMRAVLLISGMIALLIMSFLFDIATTGLQMRNAEGMGYEPYLVVLFPVFEMMIVFGGMGLFWYLIAHRPRSRGVTVAYIVVGLLVLYGMPLLFFLPVPMWMYALVQYLQPGTYVFQSGAMLAVAGLLSWLLADRADR